MIMLMRGNFSLLGNYEETLKWKIWNDIRFIKQYKRKFA